MAFQLDKFLLAILIGFVIVLVFFVLLSLFPPLQQGARITQSSVYWRGIARPFHVLSHENAGNGTLSLVIQNSEPERLTLTGLRVAGFNSTSPALPIDLFAGEKTQIVMHGGYLACAPGLAYSISSREITFSYIESDGLDKVQGFDGYSKDLVGLCQ
ncbi:MAG: hypothetical protein WC506_03495 [Candidatus Micrarchaeia archaeon]